MKRFFNFFFLIAICLAIPVRADASTESGAEGVDAPIPIGIPISGLKVPIYDEKGQKVMIFESNIATKIDERTIAFEQLKIEALDENGGKIFVDVPKSIFNVNSRILLGNEGGKILRKDFQIWGDSIEFDALKKIGRLKGNVTMIITTENTKR